MGKKTASSNPPAAAQARAAQLRELLARHDRLYYIENRPEISDYDYDQLHRELADIEQRYPALQTPDSPTQRVGGAPLPAFRPVRHRRPMLSLANTYSRDELGDFCGRLERLLPEGGYSFVVEPKIDGVAVALRYEHGLLTLGSSRGNGEVGDDITANLRTIRSIPLRLAADRPPALLEVRGEVYLPRAEFAALNRARAAAGEPEFANPRNAAAGSLKLLDARQVAARPLAAIFYGCGETSGLALREHAHLLRYLRAAGLPTPPRYWECPDLPALLAAIDALQSVRAEFPFDTDGAVIKLNQLDLYERLGVTAKSPRWAVAYKYAPSRAVTRLRGITLQVGRTGALTPVAELEPVSLAGSTIERATLHNADEIARRDIRAGDLVTVEKAGDVIPAVTAVDTAARTGAEKPFVMPDNCPACGGPLNRRPGEIAWRCENLHCPAQVKRWIMHFAGRDAMDIENLGEVLADQLVDRGLVKDPVDLYQLTAQSLAGLERLGSKSADNLLAGIAASKRRPLSNLIFALGIRHVGLGMARVLEQHFDSLDALARADPRQLEEIRDIGPVAAASIVEYFAAPRTASLIRRLHEAGVNLRRLPGALTADRRFAGRSFVLTGALARMPRAQAEAEIRRRGGRVTSSVSSKTDYAVAGADPGSKLERALKLGVAVLSEDDFAAMLSDSSAAAPDAAATPAMEPPDLRRPGELPL